jgi:eukaryotic-like serine/threonine-protein kinase
VWQVSTGGGSLPRFSRSGRELFFVSAANELRAVEVVPGATFAWGEPETLFSLAGYRLPTNGRSYDIAPGDQRFLLLRLIENTTRNEVIVVENFFEELKRKVPR